jgi:hypothetical protein
LFGTGGRKVKKLKREEKRVLGVGMTAKRGRKSAGDLVAAQTIAGAVSRLERPSPPSELTDEQSTEWWAVVNRMPAAYFPRETHALLVQYCRHVVTARRVAQLIAATENNPSLDVAVYKDLLKMQEAEGRAISSLATRMRLTQQATVNAKVQKPLDMGAAKKPWDV